jgi:hypothetical protein
MKALRLVVGLNLLMSLVACGGAVEETDTSAMAVSSDESALVATSRMVCALPTTINGQLAALSCCRSGHESTGDNPGAGCVSDWCVTQCQEDCQGNDSCYVACYGSCRNAVFCECP